MKIGIDLGDVRIGVARSDVHGILATPVETIPRGNGDHERLAALVHEHEAVEVIIGLPIGLSGKEGAAAAKVREWTADFCAKFPGICVRFVDERMSTVSAAASLRQAGKNAKTSRHVIDQAAAVVILQTVLDAERSS